MRLENDLRTYQKYLVQALIERKKVLLAVDMGLGKTVSVLTAINVMKDTLGKVLIVAPKRVAQQTWPDEFEQWEHLKDLDYRVIKGTPAQRFKILQEDCQIFIINKENMEWLYNRCGENFFGMIVWDESSSLKGANMKTKSNKLSRFGALCKMTANADRVVLLTGTPTPNGVEDLFGQMKALEPSGKILGDSKYKFFNKYFRNISRDHTYPIWKPFESSFKDVMVLCDDYIIKMKQKDYLELPDILYIDIPLEYTAAERKIYDEFKKHMVDENYEVIAKNPAVLINKLLQLNTGCMYKEDKDYIVYNTVKIDSLKEFLQENSNENILLFYNYKHEIEELKKALPEIVVAKSDKDYNDWKAGKIKWFAVHPASAGHGLNLQTGGNIIVWLSLPWSPEFYLQSNKRLHRSGQVNTVKVYHFLMKKTVDEYQKRVLDGKEKQSDMIEQFMKNLI